MLNKRILVLIFVVAFTFGGCLPIPTPPNEAPIITSTPITTATVGVLYTYNVNATDPDGNTLAYSLVVKPSGMTINSATGLIKWTPTAKGDYPVTVKVSDGTLSINQNFTIKVKAVNHAPSITSIPITTATVGVTYVYDVNATDPDGDTLTYSLTTKPSGMAINPANGLIWWVPTSAQVGSRSVTVKVSDGSLSITQSFKITVSTLPVVNQAPTITSSPNLIATVGIKYTYTIKAIDPNGDAIIYSLVSGPTGMTFNGIATINWKPTKIGVYGVTVKASDGELSDTQSFEIAVSKLPVVNHAPVITSTPDDIATVGEVYTYDVEATDPDGDTLAYSFLYYDKPTGMTINSATGLIKWIPTIAQVGNNWITVEVSDGSKSDTQHFTIEVSEPELIEITVLPDTMKIIVGGFETFEVTAHYDNETTKIVTSQCHYESSNSSIAYVFYGFDKVTTLTIGTATIFISYIQHNFLTGEEITKTDEITVTVIEPVKETITIRWLEDAIRYDALDGWLQEWFNCPIPSPGGHIPSEFPATLILTGDGGYYFENVNEYFNWDMEYEGSIVIDGTGQLSGYAKYTSPASGLPIEDHFEGDVKIIFDETINWSEVVPPPVEIPYDYDGIMVGIYTQRSYAYAESLTDYAILIEKYPKAELAPDIGQFWWFVGYTDYIAHGGK